MKFDPDRLTGMKVTVMGLGLHGGGVASTRFFAERGAIVTVTDLRGREELAPSIEQLADLPIRLIIGRHDMNDFTEADVVIKNPAVPVSSPYLKNAKRVETDISIFLSINTRPVIAITGSKGKSTTASAAAFVLSCQFPETKLGGNITISPLLFLEDPAFADKKNNGQPVVLELSSWQLADLKGKGVLQPVIACITNILPDHMNHYSSMEEYIRDKSLIYREQNKNSYTLLNFDDPVSARFASETEGEIVYFSDSKLPAGLIGGWSDKKNKGWFSRGDMPAEHILPADVSVAGNHNRKNLLCAGCICRLFGVDPEVITEQLARFPGIEHRLEFVADMEGVSFYNDSAATIPEATVAAVMSFSRPVVLISGGTDKNLDFDIFRQLPKTVKTVILLKGTGTDKIIEFFRQSGNSNYSVHEKLEQAVNRAAASAESGDVILFSPGCASFELFNNEFDRGSQFKAIIQNL